MSGEGVPNKSFTVNEVCEIVNGPRFQNGFRILTKACNEITRKTGNFNYVQLMLVGMFAKILFECVPNQLSDEEIKSVLEMNKPLLIAFYRSRQELETKIHAGSETKQ